jgi:ubiquinone/menaquinone biosynthesis C-methylase UbiE
MPDQRDIYNRYAERYERLVAREDYQGNIPRALRRIHPFDGAHVVELGAGTGRLTRIIAPWVRAIWLFDRFHPMLDVALRTLRSGARRNWRLAVADHRNVPLPDGAADVVVSGWSVCYLVVWGGADWPRAVGKALNEMARVLGQTGTIILLETLGTGNEEPEVPRKLRGYYDYLEAEGFTREWIRTDLAFESIEEAKTLMGFFFGEAMAERVAAERWVRVPECTGIWWKRW